MADVPGNSTTGVTITVGTTSSPTDPDVVVNIDKMPTLDPAHIAVSLV